jgi:hypothetical protein
MSGGPTRGYVCSCTSSEEITVATDREKPKQKRRISQELVDELKRAQRTVGEAVAAWRLPSCDILVTPSSQDVRARWERSTQWLQAFGTGARIDRHEYTVLARGIQVARADTGDQYAAIPGCGGGCK